MCKKYDLKQCYRFLLHFAMERSRLDQLPELIKERILRQACMLELQEKIKPFEVNDHECLYQSIYRIYCTRQLYRLEGKDWTAFEKYFWHYFNIGFDNSLESFQTFQATYGRVQLVWNNLQQIAYELAKYHTRKIYISWIWYSEQEMHWTGFDSDTGDCYDNDSPEYPTKRRVSFSQEDWNKFWFD